ncbi:sugar ABC transporter permease [Phytoactinopolyspora endophytica]|uniref:sugar ABC transporter permease n=1 Tax=Phytoactinopolyspora endophytica TaxID=1642495 RepID=UPI00101BF00D|nr:ABC transporter permease [Phytoactinopolyspora endophytica]
MSTPVIDTDEASVEQSSVREAVHGYVSRVRGGEIGGLPAVLGFLALVVFFSIMRPDRFATALNAANLLNQSAMIVFIAMGLVFVLLLGQIDLSAGVTAGAAAAILAVLLTQRGFPWPLTILACLLTGAVIGLSMGLIVARMGVPSFVVTLAYFLGLQGVMLWVIGEGGTIPVRDDTILAIMNSNLAPALGWVLAALVVGGYGLVTVLGARTRTRAGLPVQPRSVLVFKIGALAVLLSAALAILNQERSVNPQLTSLRGVPVIVPIAAVFLVGLTFLLTRTSFGRHVYAIGGSVEAARRAGIDVQRVKIMCFVICSTMAAIAGILFVSRDHSVSPSTGGSITLLLAVGAAVIGGTSLFGGKGNVRDAVVGGLVVAVIANGLPLITSRSAVQFIVTALVLLLAASVDALSRRRAAATGRV